MNPATDDAFACVACGAREGARRFTARERMFGTLAAFQYAACGSCGSLRIAAVPEDLHRHYPPAYHAYVPPRRAGALVRLLKRLRGEHAFGRWNPVGALVSRLQGEAVFFEWMRRARCRLGSRVLDVGCGAGHLLQEMHAAGFRDLTGADPYLPADARNRPGLRLLRCDMDELDGPYDLVMLHHAFEHVPDPLGALGQVRRLLAPDGWALIRVPVAGSFAWRTYGAHWVQLDAPRHLHLQTEKGFRELAARAGFEVADVVYDSRGLQFWGSELYRKGTPLVEPATGRAADPAEHFPADELRAFERRAAALNRAGDGDAAAYYLRPVGDG